MWAAMTCLVPLTHQLALSMAMIRPASKIHLFDDVHQGHRSKQVQETAECKPQSLPDAARLPEALQKDHYADLAMALWL